VRALVLLVVLTSSVAQADGVNAKKLGEAYRAYEDNDLAHAKKLLGSLDDKKLVATDYALWLRGSRCATASQQSRSRHSTSSRR
jgi:hypothetical protein